MFSIEGWVNESELSFRVKRKLGFITLCCYCNLISCACLPFWTV